MLNKNNKEKFIKDTWNKKIQELEYARLYFNSCDPDAFEIANAKLNLIMAEISFMAKKMK